MAIEIRFATQVRYPAQQNVLTLPIFHTAEQFIQDCQLLLNRRVSPHQTLNDKTSLIQSIFPYLYAGRFDDHLDVLLPLIQSMDNVGANFSEMVVVDKGTVDGGWDLACHQAALLHCRNLAKKQHPNTRMARQIFEIVGRNMDLYDCLFIGHLEGIITLLRQTNVNPNEPVSDFFGKCLMEEVFKNIASNLYADSLDAFPDLVRALLERHGNPNLQFKTIDIQGKGKYQNATCLHVTYLYCQSLKASGKVAEAKYVRKAFLHLLRDPRIDVRAKFTEIALERGGGHFSYTNNKFEGAYIEEGNLAHFALIERDLKTCRMVLSLAHDLIGATCFTTSGKWLRDGEFGLRYSQRKICLSDTTFWGSPRAIWWASDSKMRIVDISLCHIAARGLDLVACTFITALGGNQGISHQTHKSMIEYAKLYQLGCNQDPIQINRKAKTFRAVCWALQEAQPLPATLPQAFYVLHQEGYDVMYHPGTKCPIVREVLHRAALIRNVDNKMYQGYRQNPLIPKLNRAAHEDFKTPGVICGHAKPRADALVSDQALYDVGYLTNIMAQDPTFNNGLWKKLEGEVRRLAQHHLCLHVYTGGVFTAEQDVKGPKTVTYRVIGTNEVHMPTHLFKVIYVFDYGAGWRSLAYLIPNIPLPYRTDLEQYYTPVQRIQELTGVDFLGKYK